VADEIFEIEGLIRIAALRVKWIGLRCRSNFGHKKCYINTNIKRLSLNEGFSARVCGFRHRESPRCCKTTDRYELLELELN